MTPPARHTASLPYEPRNAREPPFGAPIYLDACGAGLAHSWAFGAAISRSRPPDRPGRQELPRADAAAAGLALAGSDPHPPALHELGYSQRAVQRELARRGYRRSLGTVCYDLSRPLPGWPRCRGASGPAGKLTHVGHPAG